MGGQGKGAFLLREVGAAAILTHPPLAPKTWASGGYYLDAQQAREDKLPQA